MVRCTNNPDMNCVCGLTSAHEKKRSKSGYQRIPPMVVAVVTYIESIHGCVEISLVLHIEYVVEA